ncbi:hypothetical protein BC777_1305 [Yoonia maricola]|uniref:Uncharacterized protein n=1 Tax=Yoonia maricola TaxID=420999 RepID=A0A2M8WNF1_9RHOB|nr:hypothetical protein [Yoonia maricola]PJI92454.1 hypothetical protein BC777_1305 [Yoonia maricola]
MKPLLSTICAMCVSSAMFFAFIVGKEYFSASQYDLTEDASVFRDDCNVAMSSPPDDSPVQYVLFAYKASMHRLCSCAASQIQNRYPDRTELANLVFNTAHSDQSGESKLASLHETMATYDLTEGEMAMVMNDVGDAVKECAT